jgi:hypothetical protein
MLMEDEINKTSPVGKQESGFKDMNPDSHYKKLHL